MSSHVEKLQAEKDGHVQREGTPQVNSLLRPFIRAFKAVEGMAWRTMNRHETVHLVDWQLDSQGHLVARGVYHSLLTRTAPQRESWEEQMHRTVGPPPWQPFGGPRSGDDKLVNILVLQDCMILPVCGT